MSRCAVVVKPPVLVVLVIFDKAFFLHRTNVVDVFFSK